MAVIPAKAGIHFALMQKAKMDSRFRGNDGHGVTFGPHACTKRFCHWCQVITTMIRRECLPTEACTA